MLELKIKAGRRSIPIFDLPTAIGRKAAYAEIGDQIDALIAFVDDLQGDVDLEDGGDDEPDTDAMGDQAWPEWHTLPAPQRRAGRTMGKALPECWSTPQEDDEEFDPAEEDDPSGQCDEDGINTDSDLIRYTTGSSGAGCPISDPGGGNVEDEAQAWFVPAYSGPIAPSAGRAAANDA